MAVALRVISGSKTIFFSLPLKKLALCSYFCDFSEFFEFIRAYRAPNFSILKLCLRKNKENGHGDTV